MKQPVIAFILPFLGVLIATSLADNPAPPRPLTTMSANRQCIFTMLPPKWKDTGGSKSKIAVQPFGAAYQLRENGELAKLWAVKGWYDFEVFLSNDGRFLVRIGDWPEGDKPSKDHLAVAFYDSGKFLKSYSTADLVKDPSKVFPSISHYRWMWRSDETGTPELASESKTFSLTTTDGHEYEFDLETGSIKLEKKVSMEKWAPVFERFGIAPPTGK